MATLDTRTIPCIVLSAVHRTSINTNKGRRYTSPRDEDGNRKLSEFVLRYVIRHYVTCSIACGSVDSLAGRAPLLSCRSVFGLALLSSCVRALCVRPKSGRSVLVSVGPICLSIFGFSGFVWGALLPLFALPPTLHNAAHIKVCIQPVVCVVYV